MSVIRTPRSVAAAVLVTVALALSPLQSAFAGQGPKPGPPPASATTPPATRPAAAAAPEVQAQYVTADGVTHGASYLAAPGVSSTQLYQRLKAQGVRNLVTPSTGGIVALTGSCGYGTAGNVNGTCPPVTWARNGFTNPQIYYHDTTGSSWPVGTVLSEWNNSPNIHVAWAPSGCPSISGSHCVNVVEGYLGATGYEAITYYSWNSGSHFVDGSVSIHFNDSYSSNHQAVACHESGHSFGMGHNSSTASCLYAVDPQATWPSSDDYNEILYQLYPR